MKEFKEALSGVWYGFVIMVIAVAFAYCMDAVIHRVHAQPRALVVTGIFGEVVSPMNEIAAGLKAAGYKVTRAPWYAMPTDANTYDLAVGHSAGDAILHLKVKRKITIDPTFLNVGCLYRSRCTNFYNGWDAFPLGVCCGGYPVKGAKNIIAPAGHTQMPARIWRQVVKEAR